jgi:hypothetical protein
MRWSHICDGGNAQLVRVGHACGKCGMAYPVKTPSACSNCGQMPDACECYAQPDDVNAPKHYNQGPIECIDAIKQTLTPEQFKGYLTGNCMKYLWRHAYKNGKQDLQKLEWYLGRLLEEWDA